MGNEFQILYPDGRTQVLSGPVSLLSLARGETKNHHAPIVAALVNNEEKDLQSVVDRDSQIQFIDLASELGVKVYQRSLAFVAVLAAAELFPENELTVEHSLGRGLYCELHAGRSLEASDVAALEDRMRAIVAVNSPIVRQSMALGAAIELFLAEGQRQKAELLRQLRRETVRVYACRGRHGYFYGTMTPSAGYLETFALMPYGPGFVLRYPQKDGPDRLPPFEDQPKLFRIFQEAEQWCRIMQCGYVPALNQFVRSGEIVDIIRVAEALHEKKLAQIADFVAENCRRARVILVAGPSSAGKTTFAQRLKIQLLVNGIRPVPLSLDDYFLDREHSPRDAEGKPDFEALEAIDLELFNDHLTAILAGSEVAVPTYSFVGGKREYTGRRIRIGPDQPLIVEGIHGLNERLTSAVPRDQKVKIYVSALTQMGIDAHNRISTADTRLIRRLVRDSQFRGHDALRTLRLWNSVRRGEEKNIFPFQEDADVMFNSALIYELSVLKKYAEPLLQEVTQDCPEFAEARRLLNFLEYFEPVGDEAVMSNSILREFIGQSCFHP